MLSTNITERQIYSWGQIKKKREKYPSAKEEPKQAAYKTSGIREMWASYMTQGAEAKVSISTQG